MQVSVPRVKLQPVPFIDVAVRPAGRVSVTVTVAVVGPRPLLLTMIEYAAPVCPWVKLPVWVLLTVRSGTNARLMVVRSVAESLRVLVSPPPETATELVTEDAALLATFTVKVIAG